MADYYNGNNREEDERVKLMDKVYDWWESLSEEEQYDIISNWCPEDITKESDADDMFGNMLWSEQFRIYKDNNPKEFMSPDELYDGGVSSVEVKAENEDVPF